MSDLNSIRKYKCAFCSKKIDFVWSSNIYNNSKFARLCDQCREIIFKDLYHK